MRPYQVLVVSDLHLTGPHKLGGDSNYQACIDLLESFAGSSCNELILMGDIFDILVGPYKFWRTIYKDFFSGLEKCVALDKKITWVQGNHDFQLTELLEPLGIEWIFNSAMLERRGLKICVSHGDLAASSRFHPYWRKFLTSQSAGFLLRSIPENLAEKLLYPLGSWMSKTSRASSGKPAGEKQTNRIRQLFRDYAQTLSDQYDAKLAILGHSHLRENCVLESGVRYLNTGSWYETHSVGMMQINSAQTWSVKLSSAEAWLNELA